MSRSLPLGRNSEQAFEAGVCAVYISWWCSLPSPRPLHLLAKVNLLISLRQVSFFEQEHLVSNSLFYTLLYQYELRQVLRRFLHVNGRNWSGRSKQGNFLLLFLYKLVHTLSVSCIIYAIIFY